MTATSLPPAGELAATAKGVLARGGSVKDASRALDPWAPAVDELADAAAAARFLGLKVTTVYMERWRGTWPPSDVPLGRSGLWRYRTLVLHRAQMPGRGSAGRGRPSRARTAA